MVGLHPSTASDINLPSWEHSGNLGNVAPLSLCPGENVPLAHHLRHQGFLGRILDVNAGNSLLMTYYTSGMSSHFGKERIFQLGQIGIAGETTVWVDTPRNYTITEKGTKEVFIKTSGCEKQRVIVMLAITEGGGKLPSFLIFK